MVKELEDYAIKYNIPIMQKDGMEYLLEFIREKNVKSILEIGTAIGYSAIRMSMVSNDILITTIERDELRYKIARKNVSKYDFSKQITLVLDDALNFNSDDSYDLIFIDASKSSNIKFFERFKKNLRPNGYIITDNLSFHGLVDSEEKLSKNIKGLVRKIKDYKGFLKDNKEFETVFLPVGDGISISRKIV